MTKFVKKAVVLTVAVATVATFGLGFVVPQVSAVSEGDLVKGPNSDAVYYIGADNTKYVFPDAKTYFSWYSDFSGVQLLTVAEMDTYADGGMVLYRAGTKLITHPNTAKVYAVEPSGNLRWIPSEEVAAGLYGADWASRVNDISEVFFPNYTIGSDLESSTDVPDGSLVKMEGDSTIYLISGTEKRPFASMDALTANGYMTGYVLTVSDLSGYTDGSSITGAESSLMDVSQGGTIADGGGETPTGGLSVSLNSSTPESSTLVKNSDRVLMTVADFTANDGDVVVTGMKIKRTGVGSYNDFNKVWVEVDGLRRGSQKSLNSTDEASLLFSSDSKKVTISDGETKTFYVYASIGNASSGNLNAFRIMEVSTSSDVSGLPVTGNSMSMSGVEAPDVEYDDQSVGTDVNIGDNQAELAKLKITNKEANEDAVVRALTFKSDAPSSGTKIDNDDVQDFYLYDDGDNVVAGPENISSDGYIRFVFDSPFTIEKGGSYNETFTVKGDIMDGPGRKVGLDIEYASDLDIIGGTNGYGTDNTSSTWAQTDVTIGNAVLSVNLADDSPLTRTIDDQTNDVVLVKGNFRADQGSVTATAMRVTLTGSDMDFGTTDEYENLRVYINGILTSEATGSSISSSDDQTSINVDFTDEFTVSGTVPFEVRIDAKTVGGDEWIKGSVPGSSITATRDSDNGTITPTGTATGNKVTFGTPSVTVTGSAVAPSVTRVKGSDDVIFAAFDVSVGTASDVTLKSIKFEYGADDGAGGEGDQTADQNDLQNITLLKSDKSVWKGPENLNSSEQVNFTSLAKKLTAGSTMRFYVRADINDSINDSDITDMWLEIIEVKADDANGDAISVTEDGTNTIDAATYEVNNDGENTTISVVDSGKLSVQLDPATPDSSAVLGSQEGVVANKLKFRAEYEDVNITTLKVKEQNTATNGDDDVNIVHVYKDGELVASSGSIVSGVVTFNFATGDFVVPSGETVNVEFRYDVNTTNDSIADTGQVLDFAIADFNADIEAQGTSNTIYAYPYKYNGTGVTLTSNATAAINDASNITATATSITYDTLAVGTMNPGNLIKIDSEYMLITADTGSVLTVVRGVANSTAASHNDDAVITEYDVLLEGNAQVVYASHPIITLPTQPTGELRVGTFDAFKFTVTPRDGGEEDLRLEEVLVRMDGAGIDASGNAGWYITDYSLYNGNKLVGSQVTTDVESSGNLSFQSLDSDDDGIITGPTTFTVRVTIALGTGGAIDQGDTMQLSLDSFGSIDGDGSITPGDFDWIDMEASSTVIEWVDTDDTLLQGTTFIKS